jgi:hypothetical protein
VDAPMTRLFAFGCQCRRATEQQRYCLLEAMHISRRSAQRIPPDIGARPETVGRRKSGVVLLACICVYVVSYLVLSLRGSYIGHNQGGSDNRSTWFPAFCAEPYVSPAGRQKVRLTVLGWLFLPAMLVDQVAIHRTHFDVE